MSIVTYNWHLNANKTHFWSHKSFCFSTTEINKIHQLASQQPKLGGLLSDNSTDDSIRTSEMCFLPSSDDKHDWLFKKFTEQVGIVNQELFKYDLQTIESLQYTVYNKGAFYKDHVDTLHFNINGMRKLSFVLMLSEAHEYEGGDLILKYGSKPITAPREKGTLIFFPSFTLHEVTPVTKGTRKTLVGWVQGPNFK